LALLVPHPSMQSRRCSEERSGSIHSPMVEQQKAQPWAAAACSGGGAAAVSPAGRHVHRARGAKKQAVGGGEASTNSHFIVRAEARSVIPKKNINHRPARAHTNSAARKAAGEVLQAPRPGGLSTS
jgi:hypothetical protein